MPFIAKSDAPPLREDASGAIRVGETRVLLELVVRSFQDGGTPEMIVQRYSTLTLSDVYTVIAYFYCNRCRKCGMLSSRRPIRKGRLVGGHGCPMSEGNSIFDIGSIRSRG